MKKLISTDLNALVAMVKEKEGIKLEEAAAMLEIDADALEHVAKILVKHRILEIHYSFKGHRILKRGEKIMSAAKPEKAGEKNMAGKTDPKKCKENELLFRLIRTRIHERRGKLPGEIKRHARTEHPGTNQARMQAEKPTETEVRTEKGHASVKHPGADDLSRLKEAFTKTREDVERLRRNIEEDPLVKKAGRVEETATSLQGL